MINEARNVWHSKDTTTYDSYKNKIKKRVDAGSAALPRPRAQRGASVRVLLSTLLSHDRVVIAQHNPGESPSLRLICRYISMEALRLGSALRHE